jgi:hypothetical protein
MSGFKMPDSYYEQPEVQLYFIYCESCDDILDSNEEESELKLIEECPKCKNPNLYFGRDYFHI